MRDLALPAMGSVMGWGSEATSDALVYGFASYTVPPGLYGVELPDGGAVLGAGRGAGGAGAVPVAEWTR